MTKSSIALAALAIFSYSPLNHAGQPKIGASVDGGVFLYREAVERYWNDWVAYPLMAKDKIPTTVQARATIVGDGKTATFIGNLSINCENGKHFWESAGSGSEFLSDEKEADEIVPRAVVRNAVKMFCKK